MKLAIVVGTNRNGRQTPKQAQWVWQTAHDKEGIEAEIVDLAHFNLPFFQESISPRYNQNREIDPVVKPWLNKLEEADAYIFVTPEYNHSIPGILKNAMDFVTWEMLRKPSAIVSHGTVGGARAAMHLKEILSEARGVPIPNFVALAHMSDVINDKGELMEEVKANPYGPQSSLESLLDELKFYSDALSAGRKAEKQLQAAAA